MGRGKWAVVRGVCLHYRHTDTPHHNRHAATQTLQEHKSITQNTIRRQQAYAAQERTQPRQAMPGDGNKTLPNDPKVIGLVGF